MSSTSARGKYRRRFRERLRRARQCRALHGRAPAPRTHQPRPRGAIALRRSLLAGVPCRRVARHGAALRHCHLATHNLAVAGVRKSFTSLPDEFLFIDENTRGILSFQRAADALARIVRSACRARLRTCCSGGEGGLARRDPLQRAALRKARRRPLLLHRAALLQALPRRPAGISRRQCRRFFRHQRDRPAARALPGERSLLRQLLVDKMLFMLPSDQARLRECMTPRSLLDELLAPWTSTPTPTGSGATRAPSWRSATSSGRRGAAPRPARLALHRGAGGRPAGGALGGHHRERPAPPRADPLAGAPARLRTAAPRPDMPNRHEEIVAPAGQ